MAFTPGHMQNVLGGLGQPEETLCPVPVSLTLPSKLPTISQGAP